MYVDLVLRIYFCSKVQSIDNSTAIKQKRYIYDSAHGYLCRLVVPKWLKN